MTEMSLHFQKHESSLVPALNASAVQHVYVVNPPSEDVFPDKRVVGRIYDEQEQGFVAAGEAGAREWWRRNIDKIPSYLYAIVVCNEPWGDWAVVDEYMCNWIALCHINMPGLATVAGNFSVGNPEPEDARKMFWSLYAADFIGFHEYWVPEMMDNLNAWAGWIPWRYHKFMDYLGFQKPIFITECGADGGVYQAMNQPPSREGWRTLYHGDLLWYLEDLKLYYRGLTEEVQAAFVFTAGPEKQWETFGLDSAPALVNMILALNNAVLPPEDNVDLAALKAAVGQLSQEFKELSRLCAGFRSVPLGNGLSMVVKEES